MATPKTLDLVIVGGPKKKKADDAESPRELAMKGFMDACHEGDVTEALAAWDTLQAAEPEPEEEEA
jgi:hypothetical protein